MKNIWVKKDIWENVLKAFKIMKKDYSEITMNGAINRIIKEGLTAFKMDDAPNLSQSTTIDLSKNERLETPRERG